MSKIRLQDLNIDNYVTWYKGLTSFYTKNKEIERFGAAMKYLIKRQEIYPDSCELSKRIYLSFGVAVVNLAKETEDVVERDKWFLKIDHKLLYFIPSVKDWQDFNFASQFAYNQLLDRLKEKMAISVMPEVEILKGELDRMNGENLKLVDCFATATPLLFTNATAFEYDFANEVASINYCRYLSQRVSELEAENLPALKAAPQLKWNVPVNVLYTLFYDLIANGYISYEGKTKDGVKMEVARMLESYFVGPENSRLSIETIKQTLKPEGPKAQKRIAKLNEISAYTKKTKKT